MSVHYRQGDVLLLAVRLVHAEHASVAVPPGSYRVIRQREFAGGPAGWVTVRD